MKAQQRLQIKWELLPEGSPTIHERLEEFRKSGRAQKMIDLIMEDWWAEEEAMLRRLADFKEGCV